MWEPVEESSEWNTFSLLEYAEDSRMMTAKTNKQTGNPVICVHRLFKGLFTGLAKLLVIMIL